MRLFYSFICIICITLRAQTNVLTNKLNVKLESTTQSTKPPDIESSPFKPQIISDTNEILVVNGHCNLIRSFSLSNNFSYDCLLTFLPIDFMLKHHSGSETLLTAYMDSTNELNNRQDVSRICRKIRRYLF